jgi:hypothetical protein
MTFSRHKAMTKNYFKHHIWLIDVIGRYGQIARKESNNTENRMAKLYTK